MQIRCNFCHKPFALKKEEVHYALDTLQQENLTHYDAHCPHCRKVNRVSREELMRAAPDWHPEDQSSKQVETK
jgi:phage FluMu protein Com